MSDDVARSNDGHAGTEVRCALAVFSDTVTAAEVTSRVGIDPTSQRTKDERLPGRTREVTVATHRWVWSPDDSVERSLDGQLDAIWTRLGGDAGAFNALSQEATVQLDIWIRHLGAGLSLGWVLDRRHVAAAAAFGALINIDEYDDSTSLGSP